MNTSNLNWQYRLQVTSRILAAALGGYAVASAMTVFLALVWPIPPAQAVLSSTLLSFIWYAVAVIWVFSVKRVSRAWAGVILATLVLVFLDWLLLPYLGVQ